MPQKFDPSHMSRLDSPERRALIPPEVVLGAFELAPGEVLLDVGAGIGFLSFPAAAIVGPAGRVVALDSSEQMLAELRKRVPPAVAATVEARLSEEYAFGLEDDAGDLALFCTVLHEVEEPLRLLREAARCLRAGGRLGVVEWSPSGAGHGPHQGARLSAERLRGLAEEAGFTVAWSRDLNESTYLLYARK